MNRRIRRVNVNWEPLLQLISTDSVGFQFGLRRGKENGSIDDRCVEAELLANRRRPPEGRIAPRV